MALLFGKRWRIQVADLAIEGADGSPSLDARFHVERTLSLTANTARVEIFNLTSDSRSRVASASPLVIDTEREQLTIEAGYTEAFGLIFQGDVARASSEKSGADWITTVEAGDGESALREAVTVAAFAPGSGPQHIAAQLVKDLGKAGDQLVKRLKAGDFPGAIKVLQRGITSAGSSADLLRELEHMTGLSMSIQNGELIGLGYGETTMDPALYLSETSGLVGTPQRAVLGSAAAGPAAGAVAGVVDGGAAASIGARLDLAAQRTAGVVRASALMNPGIFPGRAIVLDSAQIKGDFVASRCIYTGSTFGDDWTVEMELHAL